MTGTVSLGRTHDPVAGVGDEAGPSRAAPDRGFVPRLESLEARVVLSEGKKVKIDFAITDPAQVSTVSPPAVGLVAPPAGPFAAAGPVQVPGGNAGFDPV